MQTTYVEHGSDEAAEMESPRRFNFSDPDRPTPRITVSAPKPNGNGSASHRRSLIEALTSSKLYQDYASAFTLATGLPVALRPVETWQLPHHGQRNEAPWCALMAQRSRACASCLMMQERLCQQATMEAQSASCPAGLCDSTVPVRLGDRLIGFLQTGQIFLSKPTEAKFSRALELVREWGLDMPEAELREAYFGTKVVPAKEHEAAVTLLKIFAQHLSMLSNQVIVQQENAEPPVITRAKDYIQTHQSEDLRLSQVAKAVNASTFYFCKTFKKVTGINFTDYLSRVRIEKSKNLLLNPNLRVSEIAYDVGFQSLTHFNRTFKKILGQSPSDYREQLLRN
jgi:AraC-like DNA-binding protein